MISRILAVAILPFAFNLSFADQDHSHHHGGATVISGELKFPTSCGAAVQKPFESAVAALHSFEYEVAEQQFHAIGQKNPECGMAYWGEAMSIWHQLWSRPTEKEMARGSELLAKAAKAKRLDTREKGYVTALSKFYADPKQDYDARTEMYSQAMQSVYRDNPQDTEAAVFYALSLLASAPDSDPQLKNQRQAVAILNKVYAANPKHPGIAHYIIHSTDNPELAPLGLEAARRYASLAPESPHAVHMPSHIFARLGLWRDDIASNAAAVAVADKLGHLHMEHHKMHSTDFMHYAYLQIGDDRKAQEMAENLAKIDRNQVPEEFVDFRDALVAGFAARYALERRQWREALTLKPEASAHPFVQSITYLANAVAAGHLRDSDAAAFASKRFDEMVEATKKSSKAYYAKGMENGQKEAAAWAKFAAGDVDSAVALLRNVADKQDQVGKQETEMPAREMLADMLLDAKRPTEALREYEVSLKTDPNRFNGLYGAAQAAEQTGKAEQSKSYYSQLLKNCEGVESDRAELLRARTLVASR
jgi:tetratricopeptide (TPR) repeat protein